MSDASRPARPTAEIDEIVLTIEKVVYGGEGLGYARGKACFVDGTLAGEKVRAAITHDRKNHLKAKLIEVLEPSPHRIRPACPYVSHCGGCQYQHVNYAEELGMKESQVREALTRALSLDSALIGPITASPKDLGYRNNVTLHRTNLFPAPQRLAFVGRDNMTPIVVDRCLLVDERLEDVFTRKVRLPVRQDGMSFKLDEKGEPVSDRSELYFRVRAGGESILTSSEGFFQNNLEVTGLVARELKAWVEGLKPEVFLDLYAGVGTFTVLSAGAAARVVCAEESKTSLECLRINLVEKRNGTYKILKGRVENTFPQWFEAEKPADSVIFLDPPRQGLAPKFADWLGRLRGPRAAAYLSCDLATLTRDLKIILGGGLWRVARAMPFDMFPRTKHIETLVLLEPAH